ncbi:MAG TPA: hypothetical protein VK425_12615, partial [Acidimicrobiales bacterium]|nr:hypothetical protein [Acidimicrobiales bacterium]
HPGVARLTTDRGPLRLRPGMVGFERLDIGARLLAEEASLVMIGTTTPASGRQDCCRMPGPAVGV